GSGVMPLGMIYTITHLAALGGMDPALAIAAATGNNAAVYGLDSGVLAPGRTGDLVLIDAPLGGTADTALAAPANGDPVAIAAVVSDGVPRFVGRSRNTPPTTRKVQVIHNSLPRSFDAAAH